MQKTDIIYIPRATFCLIESIHKNQKDRYKCKLLILRCIKNCNLFYIPGVVVRRDINYVYLPEQNLKKIDIGSTINYEICKTLH